ncbi:uncharacterized protein LOC143299843 isoform X2 [Babylonia areolata]|uniref:uncharacterized protein LOC143299843 isoform X2 n=1 Tax=Babylonia areolata TaxID=304850 RepID=UPI003FCF107D
MQGIGQLLVSTLLLLLPLLSVLAHKTDDDHTSHFSKRSISDGASSWQTPTSSDDDLAATKRFNEFVGKRAGSLLPDDNRFDFLYKRYPTKRSAEVASAKRGKRSSQYEFLGKRPQSPPHKRSVLDLLGKRVLMPYEFVGKRILGGAWERVSANAVEGDALLKEVTDILNKRQADDSNKTSVVPRNKRYAEWLGKRGGPIADQLLRDLVNKRISAMMRNRLQNSNNPEFIGRREEDYLPLPEDMDVKKRYTEFIGK